jgi:hypothetical protein
MDVILVFGADNDHPLAWLLNKSTRHVWCAVREEHQGYWVSYNWHCGLPIMRTEAPIDFDLAGHYRALGLDVVEMEAGTKPVRGPLMINNCVGHVMVVCGIRARFIYTPWQLLKHVRGRSIFQKAKRAFSLLQYAPGFGGGGGSPPPPLPPLPPLPPPPPPPASQVVRNRQAKERRLKREAKDQSASITDESTPNTLLG